MAYVVLVSTIAGMATAVGGLIVALAGKPSVKTLSFILGVAAGVNIVVATMELLPAAIEHGSVFLMCVGFIVGILIMSGIERIVPSISLLNNHSGSESQRRLIKTGYMIAIGLAVHNLPEGLAIGAGYQAAPSLGLLIAIAIGLHNVPEGMGAAAPLKMAGASFSHILLVTTIVGLATPLGTIIGQMLMTISTEFISLFLAFGGAAIMYIVAKELIPESNKQHAGFGVYGITLGILITIILATSDLLL